MNTNTDRYYIYYIHKNGDSMFLTECILNPNGDIYIFTPTYFLTPWKKPLLFPTLEQVETFFEILYDTLPAGLLADAKESLNIGRWISLALAKSNEHPDPYEWATWKPGE